MAINFNLSDLSRAQRFAGTGRRHKTPSTMALLDQEPAARSLDIKEVHS